MKKFNTEIQVDLSFRTERCDYGVDHSPVWEEIIDHSLHIESLWMFGREWSDDDLRETFGVQGAEALMGLIFSEIGEDWDYD